MRRIIMTTSAVALVFLGMSIGRSGVDVFPEWNSSGSDAAFASPPIEDTLTYAEPVPQLVAPAPAANQPVIMDAIMVVPATPAPTEGIAPAPITVSYSVPQASEQVRVSVPSASPPSAASVRADDHSVVVETTPPVRVGPRVRAVLPAKYGCTLKKDGAAVKRGFSSASIESTGSAQLNGASSDQLMDAIEAAMLAAARGLESGIRNEVVIQPQRVTSLCLVDNEIVSVTLHKEVRSGSSTVYGQTSGKRAKKTAAYRPLSPVRVQAGRLPGSGMDPAYGTKNVKRASDSLMDMPVHDGL